MHKTVGNIFKDIAMKSELDEKPTFLDMLVRRKANCTLKSPVYWERIHTDQILDFLGNHRNNRRRSCI